MTRQSRWEIHWGASILGAPLTCPLNFAQLLFFFSSRTEENDKSTSIVEFRILVRSRPCCQTDRGHHGHDPVLVPYISTCCARFKSRGGSGHLGRLPLDFPQVYTLAANTDSSSVDASEGSESRPLVWGSKAAIALTSCSTWLASKLEPSAV